MAEKVDMGLTWIFVCREKWIDLAEKVDMGLTLDICL